MTLTILLIAIFITQFPLLVISYSSSDSLPSTQVLTTSQSLVSTGGAFELGFFQPGSSGCYLGIWYQNIPVKTYAWVANRDEPLTNTSATTLSFTDTGNLVLLDHLGSVKWSPNITNALSLRLLNSGNLVVQGSGGVILWQSFDFPTDTLLPDMKLGWDLRIGKNRFLSSWRSAIDPSVGNFSFKMDYRVFPEFFLREGEAVKYRSGPWNGVRFSGVPEISPIRGIKFNFVANRSDVYYSFTISNSSLISRLTVSPSGDLERYTWVPNTMTWIRFWYAPKDQCDSYKECGGFGVCNANESPVCECPKGFAPRNPVAWELRDGTGGCVRKTAVERGGKVGFLEMRGMKVPESSTAVVDQGAGIEECRRRCTENCNCTAFANADVSNGGSGCVMWSGELLDLRNYAAGGQVLFLRLAASDLDEGHQARIIIISVVAVVSCCVLIAAIALILRLHRDKRSWAARKFFRIRRKDGLKKMDTTEKQQDSAETKTFDLECILIATNHFSHENTLGQGGYGPVYKGRLNDGKEVAVKRLSKSTKQGIEEFKNEATLISKLQHRNLVRLIGCCSEEEEKILIYEFMPNKSLDVFIFDPLKSRELKWETRFNIILGVAKGLLYLHHDSLLRIIHRDLKVGNILLDDKMNPKISDFGLSRIFEGTSDIVNTHKVVGTIGYMSPEYALAGNFSEKSDVFSFGVLILEIVSSKKNTSYNYLDDQHLSLISYAWHLWSDNRGIDLVDAAMADSCCWPEVIQCIHIGLLCVQDHADDRPTMPDVVFMLSNETNRPQPRKPTLTIERRSRIEVQRHKEGSSSEVQRLKEDSSSVNDVTISMFEGR